MGLGPFSSYKGDTCRCSPSHKTSNYQPNNNPDPSNYKILNSFAKNGHLVLEILYPDCTNYEGRKVLVFLNTKLKDLERQGSIDPHFTCDVTKFSPFARFAPTLKGWSQAIDLIQRI